MLQPRHRRHRPTIYDLLNIPQRLGGVRCYWALLVPQYGPPGPGGQPGRLELKFVYVDPVLNSHLGRQNVSFLNRGVMELIHPSEREQARTDLTNAIQSDDLQGSVTRIRFSRVSCIRKMLGAQPQELDVPPEMASVAEDSDYLIVDLVLNWVADGLLLAFFHAIKDMDPSANSDPSRRHEGWSNFCGSSGMSDEQAAALQQNISMHVSPPQRTRYPPRRVFQLHSVQANGSHPTSSLVFSWPPPRPMDVPSQPFDGLYDPDEYADMMRGVDMDPNALAAKPGEVRTNCTTRFGAEHSIRTEGVYRHISSVFIPYDQIIFACFQTTKLYELPNTGSVSTAQESWNSPTPTPPGGGPPGPLHGARGGTPHTPHAPSREWQTPTGTPGSDYDRAPYAPPPPPPQGPVGHYAPEYAPPHPYPPPGAHPGVHGYPDGNADYHHHHGSRLGEPPLHHHAPAAPPPPPSRGGGSTRPLVRPPGDVEKCRGCGTRESPEWRKGENGVKDLCNACGLKLARAVAKREGRQKPRKKDK